MPNIKYKDGPVTVAIGQTHTVELPSLVSRVRLTGLLFETDKTFLLPVAMHGIRGLVDLYQQHPKMALVITGHTDRVGDADYNLALSDERAQSIAHYLKDEVDPWLQCYQGSAHSQPWGTREDQHMLSAIADDATGDRFYRGPINGQLDAATVDAVRRFQGARHLAVDGAPGPDTRRALITAYQQLDGTTLPAGAELQLLGCGENHNEAPTADGEDEPRNRRVEIFLFDPGPPDPAAPARCPGDGCPYLEWKKRTVETIDFDHDLCELLIECVRDDDRDPSPIPQAEVTLSRNGQVERQDVSDDNGNVWFNNLLPGRYTARGQKEGYQSGEREVQARSASYQPASDQQAKSIDGDSVEERDLKPKGGGTPLPMKPFPIEIQLEDAPPLDGTPQPGRWLGTWLEADFGDGKSMGGSADGTGRIVMLSPYKPEGVITRVEMGAHLPDPGEPRWDRVEGVWDIQNADKTVKSSVHPNPLTLTTRLRLSMYLGVNLMTPQGKFDSSRLWTATDPGFAGVIDDISIVRTIENTETNDMVRFRGTGELINETAWAQYYADLLEGCHARGIQVLAGIAMSDQVTATPQADGTKIDVPHDDPRKRRQFRDIINDPARRAAFAQSLCDFIYTKHGLAFDGLSFDLELDDLGPNSSSSEAVTDFYVKVHDCLMDSSPARNPILAVICAPYTADDGKTLFVPNGLGGQLPVAANMQTHRFAIAKNRANVIMRLMEDGPKKTMTKEAVKAWHEEAVAFAVGDGGLRPSQVQLVLAPGPSFATGEIEMPTLVDRCGKLARRNHIGMGIFAFPSTPTAKPWGPYAAYDSALNPNGPNPNQAVASVTVNPGVVVHRGYPLQVPTGKEPRDP